MGRPLRVGYPQISEQVSHLDNLVVIEVVTVSFAERVYDAIQSHRHVARMRLTQDADSLQERLNVVPLNIVTQRMRKYLADRFLVVMIELVWHVEPPLWPDPCGPLTDRQHPLSGSVKSGH